jgi:hypothetical protein
LIFGRGSFRKVHFVARDVPASRYEHAQLLADTGAQKWMVGRWDDAMLILPNNTGSTVLPRACSRRNVKQEGVCLPINVKYKERYHV